MRALVCQSLVWRAPASITDRTAEIVRGAVASAASFRPAFAALLDVAARPEHPLNARWTHQLVADVPMPDRDALLCPYLHVAYEQASAVRRLIDWALDTDLTTVGRDTAVLWALTLAWFSCAADRRVRDHATKAMVRLLERQPDGCVELVERALGVDDEYVVERVLAAAYGALIRTRRDDALAALAELLLARYFRAGALPENAQIRDYARSLMELALHRGALPAGVSPDEFRPPYGSTWPTEWPGEELDDQYGDSSAEYPRLYLSCTGDDFARYTIESGLRDFEGVDVPAAQRWVFRHVLDMGYTPERFRAYDVHMLLTYGGGRARPSWAERIGKKYQWIALYRLLGKAADGLRPSPYSTELIDHPLPPLQAARFRSVDPTTLLRHDEAEAEVPAWWVPVGYDLSAVQGMTDARWLARDDFPETAAMLTVERPHGGAAIILHAYPAWSSRTGTGRRTKYPYRRLWLNVDAYFLDRALVDGCWPAFSANDWCGNWFHSDVYIPYTFLGEYPWTVQAQRPVSAALARSDDSRCPLRLTGLRLSSEFAPNAYTTGRLSVSVPVPELLDDRSLRWNGIASYVSENGAFAFGCPAATAPGPSALLADKEYVAAFLRTRDLVIVWRVQGEKNIITGGPDPPGRTIFHQAHLFDGTEIVSGPRHIEPEVYNARPRRAPARPPRRRREN